MDYYDDPNFSYPAFWNERAYEHESELLALESLLSDVHVYQGADIGAGFGRLAEFLSRHVERLILIEPSKIQRNLGKEFLPKNIIVQEGHSADSHLETGSCDLVALVRVMHHVPEPHKSIVEIKRILKPGGLLVLEFANSLNFKARLRQWTRFSSIPLQPLPVNALTEAMDIPFVNHHPQTVLQMLSKEGFVILKVLSVSNFRSPLLKKMLPLSLLLLLERISQRQLARIYFGPSIFVLARRS